MRSTHFAWVSTVLAAALCTGGCDRSPNPAAPSPPAMAVSGSFAADAVKDGFAARPGERSVRVCHVTGTGRYQPILVNDSAEGAHRAHGDLLVGEAVPGLPGMVLDEGCVPVARALVITGGSWAANLRRRDPLVLFAIEGPELLASGRWNSTEALSVCDPCVPGDVLTVRAMFDNPLPVTIASQAAGTATVAGTVYPFVEFGGPLTFEGGTVRIPDPPATAPGDVQMVAAATPFALSGRLKGYEVLGGVNRSSCSTCLWLETVSRPSSSWVTEGHYRSSCTASGSISIRGSRYGPCRLRALRWQAPAWSKPGGGRSTPRDA